MKPQIDRSWFALSEAIGRKRRRVADVLDLHEKTIEAMCRPQVGDSLESQANTGRHNILDDFLTLRQACERPDVLDAFVAEHTNLAHLPDPPTLPGHLAAMNVAELREMLDALLTEINRRVPNWTVEELQAEAQVASVALDRLTGKAIQRRQRATKPNRGSNRV